MSEKRRRSGKRLVPLQSFERENEQKSDAKQVPNLEESIMSDVVRLIEDFTPSDFKT